MADTRNDGGSYFFARKLEDGYHTYYLIKKVYDEID